MKKSKIAAGIIVALGAVWCGGAWYTGQTIEKQYFKQIEQLNARLAQSAGNKLTYKNVKFERGLFSTHIDDQVEIHSMDQTRIVPLSTTIYHGPLPLDRLAQFNLSPAMLSAQMLLGKNDTTQPLFEMTKSEKPLQLSVTTNYALQTQADLSLAAGQWQHSQATAAQASWANMDLGVNINADLDVTYRFQAKDIALQFTALQQPTRVSSLHWQGVLAEGDVAPTQWPFIFSGKGQSAVDFFEEKGTDAQGNAQVLVQKNMITQSATTVDGDFVNLTSHTTVGDVAFNQADLGKLTYNIDLNHIDGNALQQVLDVLVTAFKDHRDEPFPPELAAKLQAAGLAIFNHQPQVKLAPLSLSSDKGQAMLDLNIALVQDPKFNVMKSGLYKQFKDFSINIAVDKAAAVHLLQQFAPESEKGSVSQMVDDMAKEGEMNGLVNNDAQKVTFSLVLENNELKLNGHAIPEEQVKMMLFMLMMNSMGQ